MESVLPRESIVSNRELRWLLVTSLLVLGISIWFLGRVLATSDATNFLQTIQSRVLGSTRTSASLQDAIPSNIVAVSVSPTVQAAPTHCTTQEEYFTAIKKFLPAITINTGSQITQVKLREVQHCFMFSEVVSRQDNCPVYAAELQARCLDPVLRNQITEQYDMEQISGIGGNALVRKSDWALDYEVLTSSVRRQVALALNFEVVMNAQASTAVVVQDTTSTAIPGTDGTFATKYIEVDGSRQLLFMWDSGKYKTFTMSGAFPEWNPVGVYRIVDKSPLAWSTTANKWMPYWMAFTYDTRQNALLGVHALVYWYPGLQKLGDSKIYEPETNIGTPKSTGCMRLRLDDAQYVYEHTGLGDPIIVHN